MPDDDDPYGQDNDPYGRGNDPLGQNKRPWFGPKLFGYGTRPQTWQGYLIVGLLVVAAAIIAATTPHNSPIALVLLVPVAIIGIIARTRNR
jgi:hypothetical protein